MAEETTGKLNWLLRHLPDGLVVDAAWMGGHGYSAQLCKKYVSSGWLDKPARGVFRRPGGSLKWRQVVIALQTLLARPLFVGGRTALDLHGFAHYLPFDGRQTIHLYGAEGPPSWLDKLPLEEAFWFHRTQPLFKTDPVFKAANELGGSQTVATAQAPAMSPGSPTLTTQLWGQWDWPLVLSTPERAVFELLDELPNHESFHQADMLMEGMRTLSPRRLEQLLLDCRSVKVKRLFLFFAERHNHPWLKHIGLSKVDLGRGKRALVKGGRLDAKYQIVVPEDLYAIQ